MKEVWEQVRERYDSLNTKKGIFEADYFDYYNIPMIKKEDHNIQRLTPFPRKPYNSYSHFFLDEYQIERVWNKPKKYLNTVKQYKGSLSPDFSLYTDYPIAVQIWNTYRNRWCGAYWQEHGIKVIPTVSWSTEESYEFCFNGIELESTVAISTVGVLTDKEAIELFKDGYKALLDRLNPDHIIFYGDMIPDLDLEDVDVSFFDSFSVQRFGRYTKKR